ncbi:pentatricopeptide repeat 596 [Wolffia australiana]
MWALRRAINPAKRIHAYSRGISHYANTFLNSSFNCSHVGDCDCRRDCSSSCRCLRCSQKRSGKSLMGIRNLSSVVGEKTGNGEEDSIDGFSELEDEKIVSTEAFEHSASDLEVSEVLSDEESLQVHEDALEISDAEIEKDVEKSSLKKTAVSPLVRVIMDAPRTSIKGALDQWISKGNSIEQADVFPTILFLRRRRFYLKALQFYEWLEVNKLIEFGESDYASRLDLTAKVHGLPRAEKFIEKVPEAFKTELLYRTLLANCVASLKVNKAEEVFNKMRDLDFTVSAFACNQLLLLYKRLDRKKIADVLLMMEKENVKPSVFTYKLLIDTKGSGKDIEGMEKIVETMKNDGLEVDLTIQAMVAKHYLLSGQKEKATEILNAMEGENIEGNRAACQPLLSLYASLGRDDDVERIWKVCETSPRFEECLAAIEAFGKLGCVDKAEAVFEKMHGKFEKLSSKYYNALLKVYAEQNLLVKGKELAKRMADSGCGIGPLTWDALVRLYVRAGEVEKADSMLQKAVQQKNVKPLYSSYMAIMEVYAKRGDVHNAEKMFLRLRQSGYSGRMKQYQVLLQAYAKANMPAYGFRERMKADKIFPNKVVAAQLVTVDAFRKTGISDFLD